MVNGFFAQGVVDRRQQRQAGERQDRALNMQERRFSFEEAQAEQEAQNAKRQEITRVLGELGNVAKGIKENYNGTSDDPALQRALSPILEQAQETVSLAGANGIDVSPSLVQLEGLVSSTPTLLESQTANAQGARLEAEATAPITQQTSDMKNYRMAVSQGFTGSFVDYQRANLKAGASTVDVKLTEGEGKSVLYFTRAASANSTLSAMENALLDIPSNVGKETPLIGNFLKTPEFRQAEQAGREFLAAVLRKDTGAAITEQEFDLYGPMYLPQPGDDGATLQQKSRARAIALSAIESSLGGKAAVLGPAMDNAAAAGGGADAADPLGLR